MVKETGKFDRERKVQSTRFVHFCLVPEGDIGYLLALAGCYKPQQVSAINNRKSPRNHRAGLLTCFAQGISFIHKKTPGFLASGGEEFNPGPEMRLDRSELLSNKVLLKYKEDRESF